MKATSIVCPESATEVGGVSSGRVTRHRKDIENEEIQMYLSKLKDLVPFMPKNRKLSKLEVIQYVIDYICDLQSALETHPALNSFDPSVALGGAAARKPKAGAAGAIVRQPLGVRSSPNTILTPPPTSSSSSSNSISSTESALISSTSDFLANHQPTSPLTPDKLSPPDGRPISS